MENRYYTKSLYNEHVMDKDPWDESSNIYAKVIERIVCFEHLHPFTIAQYKLQNHKRYDLYKQDITYKRYYENIDG